MSKSGDTGRRVDAGTVRELLDTREWDRLAERLGYSTVGASIPPEAYDAWGIPPRVDEQCADMQVLAADTGYRIVFVEGLESYAEWRPAILEAHRQNPSECVVWWIAGATRVTVAAATTDSEGRAFVRRMETDLEEPDPVTLRQWAELEVVDLADADLSDPGEAYRRHVQEVLQRESMTREFFERFREALDRLIDELESGPEDGQARHDVALATLLRLVFLYFLQERGALDGDRRFVVRRYREARAAGESFYRGVLRPLFFGALNRTRGERSERASRLGRLPFLNGGLFEPLPAEREHPELTWPNAVWSEVVEDLLEHFQFAVDEELGPDENRAVDPEMLGKVFEGVMYGERRHDSGSFYTPRDVVREVVADAVVAHVAAETDVSADAVRKIVDGEIDEVAEKTRRGLADLLESFRVLDPAVGTGAFLLEALRVLERVYRVCDPAQRDGASYERRREIVHRHLFGVDVQKTAVRICELRLWLALLSAMPEEWDIDEIPPLPNLAHRVACGNSLMAPADEVRIGAGVSRVPEDRASSATQLRERHGERMRRTQDAYLEAHGEEKAELRREMEELERTLQRDLLEARRAGLEARREPYEKLESSKDLFGGEVDLDEEQRRDKEEIDAEIAALDDALEDLESGRAEFGGFSYGARFGAWVDDGGFDLIVTNPPWVRANRLERSRRKQLKARYRCFSSELWAGADEMGVSVPFGAQVDLAALFVERCIELLGPGGRLGVLLPSKLFRSLHGSGLRGVLAEHRLEAICDYSDSERRMFDATVYPATLQVCKEEVEPGEARRRRTRRQPRGSCDASLEMTVWQGRDSRSWSESPGALPAVGEDMREPWLFVPPEIREIFGRMWEESAPLGEVEALQPRRGLMTGCNPVFVRDEPELRSLLGDDAEKWSRPVMSGRDVREREVEPSGRILWPYDDRLEVQKDLPNALRNYFEERAEQLESRSDYNPRKPLWQLFRLKPGLLEPKVVWRDLAPRLEAAAAAGDVVPLNTVYFISFSSAEAAARAEALFNSEPLRAYAYALGERARGGWRRHFCWVVRMLPVPERAVGGVVRGGSTPAFGPDSDSSVADQYGLDSGAVRRLREWRCEEAGRSSREAA